MGPANTGEESPGCAYWFFPTIFFEGSFYIDLTPWKNTDLKGHLNVKFSSL